MNLIVVAIVIVVVVFLVDRFFRARTQRLRDAGLYPPAGQGTVADVERLVRAGRKIEAIKLYREIHGIGLKQAKEGVAALMVESGRGGSAEAIDP